VRSTRRAAFNLDKDKAIELAKVAVARL